jgi:hypothetical protein
MNTALLSLLLALSVLTVCSAGDGPPSPARSADGSCAVHPGSHWDLDVSSLPVHSNSA